MEAGKFLMIFEGWLDIRLGVNRTIVWLSAGIITLRVKVTSRKSATLTVYRDPGSTHLLKNPHHVLRAPVSLGTAACAKELQQGPASSLKSPISLEGIFLDRVARTNVPKARRWQTSAPSKHPMVTSNNTVPFFNHSLPCPKSSGMPGITSLYCGETVTYCAAKPKAW